MRTLILAVLMVLLFGTVAGERPTGGALPRGYNGLAAAPPMGWNNYNAYGTAVTEQLIRDTAGRMVAAGLGFALVSGVLAGLARRVPAPPSPAVGPAGLAVAAPRMSPRPAR